MMLLTALLLLAGWFFLVKLLAFEVLPIDLANRPPMAKASVVGLLFFLPFSEEIFIALSFKVHCYMYAGISGDPIDTVSVAVDARHFSPIKVLEHPHITSVKVMYNSNSEIGPAVFWLEKVPRKVGCTDPLTETLMNSGLVAQRLIPAKVYENGLCYLRSEQGQEPSYIVTGKPRWTHHRFSFFLPYQVEEKQYAIQTMTDRKPVAKYSQLGVMPGVLRRNIWPYARPYRCPINPDIGGGVVSYPFKSFPFYFLEKIISSDQKT